MTETGVRKKKDRKMGEKRKKWMRRVKTERKKRGRKKGGGNPNSHFWLRHCMQGLNRAANWLRLSLISYKYIHDF